MPKAPKKRKVVSAELESVDVPRETCVLHVVGIDHGQFTTFRNVRGNPTEKLAHLHKVRDQRLAEPAASVHRMAIVCGLIPESLEDVDLEYCGYHRQCYQRFNANLNRLTGFEPSTAASCSSRHHSPRKLPSTADVGRRTSLLFPPECIFCEKLERKVHDKTERPVTFASWKHKDSAWQQIEPQSLALGHMRLYRMVQDKDLHAVEAQCHRNCRDNFRNEYQNHIRADERAKNRNLGTEQERKAAAAYDDAFNSVVQNLNTHVAERNDVMQLTSLRLMFIFKLQEHGYPNAEYRSEKLLQRLQNHSISELISFTKVSPGDKGCIAFNLIYNKATTVEDAVASAYRLGSTDKFADVGLLLRGLILKAYNESKPLPWPPTANDMEITSEKLLPDELTRFLNLVLSGRPEVGETCAKTRRLVLSIGQDLCRAVTDGEWKLPKHILLCNTIRHLYRGKQLTIILNKLGHSESYDFSLELETALAKAIDDVSTYLTPQIIAGDGNSLFHCEWDNLNTILTNVHGSNVVNSAGGIMIQETKPSLESTHERTLPQCDRSKERSLHLTTPETLPEHHIYNRVGPKLPQGASFIPPTENDNVFDAAMQEYYVWLICRIVGSDGKQPVPALGGFISSTGITPARKSTIDYFTPINQPITDYSTVQELLRRSEVATAEVAGGEGGQQYVINTFGLGVCMKALPLLWSDPDKYKQHIVRIGQFHTLMNYMGRLTGHKCRGSGYSEILLEAQLVTSGCLKSVLSGKAYSKALFCLKTVCEAMERLLMDQFVKDQGIQTNSAVAILHLVNSCNRENLDIAMNDPSTMELIKKYRAYEDKVRKGHLGKTAKFWFSFVQHCHLIFMLQYSVKTNNFALFHKCNGEMADLFFAYDGHNYSRYLVWLAVFLNNLEQSHPGATDLLKKGSIAVARSLIPGSLCAVDKTMEETFMKFAKSTGGLSGLLTMFGGYQRWCRTTSVRAQFYEKTLEMCDMIDDPKCPRAGKHRELEAAQIKKSEEAVQRTIIAIWSFTDPFSIVDKERLYSLASGAPSAPKVENDVLRAEALGKKLKNDFIRERLQNGSAESFFEPIKRQKLHTMEAGNKTVILTSTKGKLVQYQEQSNLAFTLLIKSQLLDEPLDLNELMRYSLAPVPHSLGTPDGFFAKTNKAAMLHFLMEDNTQDVSYPKDALYIQDGMALFYVLANLPQTFGGICLQVLDNMVSKKNFIFATDCYELDSIKALERMRRGCSEKFIVDGPATRRPADFKLFLTNEQNKLQLCQLLLRVWRSKEGVSRLGECGTAVLVVEGKAHQLVARNNEVEVTEIQTLQSTQEETDSRVVLYLNHAVVLGYKSAVVRKPDTDILFILLHHSHAIGLTIYLDIGMGKHRQLINVTELGESLGSDYCTTLLGYYVFSGEDCTSAFKGKGKVTPLKKLQRNPMFQPAFRQLGEEWSVNADVQQQIEHFTCIMYGQPRETSVNTVRAKMLRKMVGEDNKLTAKSRVDLARIPPCQDSLVPHVQRVNYRVACYKHANEPRFWKPKPYDAGQGWEKVDKGFLEPVWSCGPILPLSLIDMLETGVCDEEEQDEDDMDYEEMLEYMDDDDLTETFVFLEMILAGSARPYQIT